LGQRPQNGEGKKEEGHNRTFSFAGRKRSVKKKKKKKHRRVDVQGPRKRAGEIKKIKSPDRS